MAGPKPEAGGWKALLKEIADCRVEDRPTLHRPPQAMIIKEAGIAAEKSRSRDRLDGLCTGRPCSPDQALAMSRGQEQGI